MKLFSLLFILISLSAVGISRPLFSGYISEDVYVESTTDTDGDGQLDRIYLELKRPAIKKKVPSLFIISPYFGHGGYLNFHNVDYKLLPQDEEINFQQPFVVSNKDGFKKHILNLLINDLNLSYSIAHQSEVQYATIIAHSVGTGKSTGCPTSGDMSEALGAKAVIDWLNGKAVGYYEDGRQAKAFWATGSVGMFGTSYNGTLPIMVAATGVDGLKAIVPIAAISNWYNYYRSNGLVVSPGGYQGEDTDVLATYTADAGTCQNEIKTLRDNQGRNTGDYIQFWQDRNYLHLAKYFKAATFIIHGQSDWNVRQRHAIELWNALEGRVPRRMHLHGGAHATPKGHDVFRKIQNWFDHFVAGVPNGITGESTVEVEMPNGQLITQKEWPSEQTVHTQVYFTRDGELSEQIPVEKKLFFKDIGKTKKLEELVKNPETYLTGRLVFLSPKLTKECLLSGTPRVNLNLSVLNRKAANITVAIVEYFKDKSFKVITRGWADPQNYRSLEVGELLVPGDGYHLSFDLESKQHKFSKESKIGVVLTSTDYAYTLRPSEGTEIQLSTGRNSSIELMLSR